MQPLLDDLLPDILRTRASQDGDREFFRRVGDRPVSYAEAYRTACSVANGVVELGVAHGECVVIMADNSTESICTWLGLSLAGAVEVAINTGYLGNTLVHALQNSQARVIFVEESLVEAGVGSVEPSEYLGQRRTLDLDGGSTARDRAHCGWDPDRGGHVAKDNRTDRVSDRRRTVRRHVAGHNDRSGGRPRCGYPGGGESAGRRRQISRNRHRDRGRGSDRIRMPENG